MHKHLVEHSMFQIQHGLRYTGKFSVLENSFTYRVAFGINLGASDWSRDAQREREERSTLELMSDGKSILLSSEIQKELYNLIRIDLESFYYANIIRISNKTLMMELYPESKAGSVGPSETEPLRFDARGDWRIGAKLLKCLSLSET